MMTWSSSGPQGLVPLLSRADRGAAWTYVSSMMLMFSRCLFYGWVLLKLDSADEETSKGEEEVVMCKNTWRPLVNFVLLLLSKHQVSWSI